MRRPVLLGVVLLCCAGPALAQDPPAAEAAAAPEALLSFDTSQADVQWQNGRWQLVAGGVVLKDFGRQEADARQALRLVQDLRLNQVGTVGKPRPVMEYWLADGQAPRGLVAGLRTLPIDPLTLRVEPFQGQWCLRDANRILFNFGARAGDARQAEAVLRRYGFTQVAYLGRPVPVMLVLLAGEPGLSSGVARMTVPRIASASPPTRAGGTAPPGGALPPRDTPTLAAAPQLAPPSLLAPDPATGADRVGIDPRQVRVRQDGGAWKLVQDNEVLADFGPHDGDARLALEAVRYFHFTEYTRLAGARPACGYFLVFGQAPHGYMLGLETEAFEPESLGVRQAEGGEWALYAGTRPLLAFGNRAEDARRALAAIKHYHFDTICRAAHPDAPGLSFFVRAR